jgi:NAD(P)H-quinone oxidoreductase subunit 5
LIFGGAIKPITTRSSEVLWAMVLPMTSLAAIALHLPLILRSLNLLVPLNTSSALLLSLSTLLGASLAIYIYSNEQIAKPVTLIPQWLRDFFAYDFYSASIYRVTIVALIGGISNIVSWLDRYVVDGLVNLVGLVTLLGGEGLKYNNSGQGQSYLLSIFLSLVVFGLLICWPILNRLSMIFIS